MVFSVLNGIPFVHLLSFKIPLRPAKYWMVLQMRNDIPPFVYFLPFKLPLTPIHLPLTFSMTPNGTERYWMVLNGTSSDQWYTVRCLFYHSKYHWDQQIYHWCLQWYWTVLNGIGRYWMVYRWPMFIRAPPTPCRSSCSSLFQRQLTSALVSSRRGCVSVAKSGMSEACRLQDPTSCALRWRLKEDRLCVQLQPSLEKQRSLLLRTRDRSTQCLFCWKHIACCRTRRCHRKCFVHQVCRRSPGRLRSETIMTHSLFRRTLVCIAAQLSAELARVPIPRAVRQVELVAGVETAATRLAHRVPGQSLA